MVSNTREFICTFIHLCFLVCLNQPHLQKTLLVKDAMIQNLISDKEVRHSILFNIIMLPDCLSLRFSTFSKHNLKVLHYEIGSLRLVLQRVWDVVTNMSEEVYISFRCKNLIFQNILPIIGFLWITASYAFGYCIFCILRTLGPYNVMAPKLIFPVHYT